jgi:hypothetical protein
VDGTAPTATAHRPHRWRAHGVAACLYLAVAVAIWWNVWSGHPTSTATCGCGDTSLLTWFMAWPAWAIRHGANPLFTTRLFHPDGVNLPANTSILALGTVLSPVTWIFGPVASLNVAATLAPVGGALAGRALVRRWTTWEPASFVAGLFYGFSPFVIESLTLEHVDLATVVLVPLLFLCLHELLVRQGGRPVRWGLALGGLATVQFFISSEALAMVALAAVVAGVLGAAVMARRHAGELRARAHRAVRGLATAGVTATVLLAAPVAYALTGPRALPARVWAVAPYDGNPWGSMLLAQNAHFRGPNNILDAEGYFGLHPLGTGYLGLGMAAVLIGGLLVFRREIVLGYSAAMVVVFLALSAGAGEGPWWLLRNLPVLESVVPSRLACITDLFAAIMLGVIVDRTYRSVRSGARVGAGGVDPDPGEPGRGHAAWVAGVAALGVAAVALVPIAWQYDLPFVTRPVGVPPWFTTAGARLPESAVVLTYPFASSGLQAPMTWEAASGLHTSLVGGGGIVPTPPSHPTASERLEAQAVADLDALSYGLAPLPVGTPDQLVRLHRALHDWGVTDVVIPDETGTPAPLQGRTVPWAIAYVTAATGQAPRRQDDAWVWRLGAPGHAALSVPDTTVIACSHLLPAAVAPCVLAAARPPARGAPVG